MNLYKWCVARIGGVGVLVPVGAGFLSFPCHSDWFWDPHSLLSNGYRGLSQGGKVAGALS
jgi:hypothetical protein